MSASLSGFIKLHRKLVAWGWYQDYVVKDVFLHLLLTANFKNTTWKDRELKKGQVVIGVQKMADELGFSRQQVRTALNKLKSTKEITIETTNKFSIVTIVNWGDYQSDKEEVTKKSTNTATNEQPTNNQQITNNQPQRKKYKNKRSSNSTTTTFKIPTFAEVENHHKEKAYTFDCRKFFEYYSNRNWKMKDTWQQVMAEWQRTECEKERETIQSNGGYGNIKNQMTGEDLEEIRKLKAEGLL